MMPQSRKVVWEGKFVRIVAIDFIDRNGNPGVWECVERVNSREIVAIFAVTKNREVVLCKQYRHPIQSYIVELPAGLTDIADEPFEVTAQRELLEETGYAANEVTLIQQGPFNAGLSASRIAIYYAPDVEFTGGANSDTAESIEPVLVPLKDLPEFCLSKHEDFSVDVKILSTLKALEVKGLLE